MKVRGTPDQKDGVCLRSKRSDFQNTGNSRGKPSSLRGKRLFLDLKSHKGQAALENNLKRLGAIIEKCFSKEVEWLITNQGKADDYKRAKKSEGDHERLDYVPSPFNMGHAGIDSPQAPSPNSSQATKPITRGKAIAQAANLTKTYGSSNLVDNARRWGIRIVHIENAQKWVDNEIKRYREWVKHGAADAEKKSRVTKVKRLKAPYIKFETTNEAYRPVYEIFGQLPVLHFTNGTSGCPFEARPKRGWHDTKKEMEEPAEAEERDIFVRDQIPPFLSSEKDSKATDSTYIGRNIRCEKKRADAQPKLVTAGELRQRAKSQYEKQTGYCEMCNLRYDDIDKHVLLDQHRKFVRNAKNYKALDAAIQENLTMVEVIRELVKNHVVTLSPKGAPERPELQESTATPSLASRARSKRLTRSGRQTKEPLSPKRQNSTTLSPKPTPCSRLHQKQENKQLGHCSALSNPLSDEVNLLSVSSVADDNSQPVDKNLEGVADVINPSSNKLMSPKTSKRRSARKLSLVKSADPSHKSTEAVSPAPGSSTPLTPRSSRSGRTLFSQNNNRRSLRNRSVREHQESLTTPIKRKAKQSDAEIGTDCSAEQLCIPEVKDNAEVETVEFTEQTYMSPADSVASTPKRSTKKVKTVTPRKSESPKQGTPMLGSGKKIHDRKVRKLTLKKTMSLASDHSMQKLLTEDEDDVFEGFDENDLKQTAKHSLSYENVNEVVADVDTLSDKEWDYEDIEKKEVEILEQKVDNEKGDEDAMDFGSVIQSIGSIGDQSEGDWDEHLETFICDQLTKKQECSATSIGLVATSVLGAKSSSLKVVVKSPKKAVMKPDSMFVYLSPRKKQSPRKVVFSPVKLRDSPGKLIWNPVHNKRRPLHELDNKTDEGTDAAVHQEKGKLEQDGEESVWKEDRQRFLKNYKNPARNRFLSPSSGSMLSPSARSRPHRSVFTSPTEFEDELWSGPATADRSKFAKEGNYYKPSTPKLSENLKENNKSSTPKSYLRHFRRHADSEGDRRVVSSGGNTPLRREKRVLSVDTRSPSTSVSVLDTSVYNLIDDSVNETDVKIDDDISFNFSSPQKVKPSKIRRLNSDCSTPGRCPVGNSLNTSGHGNTSMQKDWLDDLDDPNMGNQQNIKQKSIFKHSPRTKKSYKFNYGAAAESKLPHWRKKYVHMNKVKTKKSLKGVIPTTRLSKRLSRNVIKDNAPNGGKEKTVRKEKLNFGYLQKGKGVKDKKSEAISAVTPKKSEVFNFLSLSTSGAALNTSGATSDVPVSPRTRRNLLSLVVGLRQHNKIPMKDLANTSGLGSENGKEAECCTSDNKGPTSVQPGKDQSSSSVESKTITDLSKMQSLRVSLKRLPSPVLKGRPTRACRRLLDS